MDTLNRKYLDKHPLGTLALEMAEQLHDPLKNEERWAICLRYLEMASRPPGVKDSTPPSEGDSGDSTSPEAPNFDWSEL